MAPERHPNRPPITNQLRLVVVLPTVLVALALLFFAGYLKWAYQPEEQPGQSGGEVVPNSKPSRAVRTRKLDQPEETVVPSPRPSRVAAKPNSDPVGATLVSNAIPEESIIPIPLPRPDSTTPRTSAAVARTNAFEPGITGKIVLRGRSPAETPIPLDPACGRLHTQPLTTHHFVVAADGGLANVFVYVKEGVPNKNYKVPVQPALLDQVGCEYMPYILGLQTRQKLLVTNSDSFVHNVHATPTAPGNPESNRAQLPGNHAFSISFDSPELFLRFKCDIHPWMFAYVSVLDHPFFAVTDTTGAYVLPRLPRGHYVIEAAHRKIGSQLREVDVGSDGRLEVNFIFDAPPAQ